MWKYIEILDLADNETSSCGVRSGYQCFREIWCLYFCSEDGSSISSETFVLCVRLHSVITKKTVILNFNCCRNHKSDLLYKSYDQFVITFTFHRADGKFVSVHHWILQFCNSASQMSGTAHLYTTLLCTTITLVAEPEGSTLLITKPAIMYSSETAPCISDLQNPSS